VSKSKLYRSKTQARKVAKILRDAAKLLKPDDGSVHWTKGSLRRHYGNGQVAYCAVGAINMAACGDSYVTEPPKGCADLADTAIGQGNNLVRRRNLGPTLMGYNDMRARTVDDIVQILCDGAVQAERAAKRLEAKK